MAQWMMNPSALPETQEACVQSLDWEDPLEEENGNLLQYSCLKNPMDRGAWWPIVPGTEESDTTEHAGTRGFFVFCWSRRRPGISISGKVPRSQVPAYLKGVGE